jgi:hypothetical protein
MVCWEAKAGRGVLQCSHPYRLVIVSQLNDGLPILPQCYEWRFMAKQFVLAPSSLRLIIRDHLYATELL